ncbi:unnamed protein product [Victoria cruziana]
MQYYVGWFSYIFGVHDFIVCRYRGESTGSKHHKQYDLGSFVRKGGDLPWSIPRVAKKLSLLVGLIRPHYPNWSVRWTLKDAGELWKQENGNSGVICCSCDVPEGRKCFCFPFPRQCYGLTVSFL